MFQVRDSGECRLLSDRLGDLDGLMDQGAAALTQRLDAAAS